MSEEYRIEIRTDGDLGRYYPQYYTKEWFYGLFGGWKSWNYLSVDILGFALEEELSFANMKSADEYLEMHKKQKIVKHIYQNKEDESNRT